MRLATWGVVGLVGGAIALGGWRSLHHGAASASLAAGPAGSAAPGNPRGSCCTTVPPRGSAQAPPAPSQGLVWVPAGAFTMGSDAPDARPDERPRHRVSLPGFWMDATLVTNAQFRAFVAATGYVTTAERAPDLQEIMRQCPPGTPPPSQEMLVPASLVFKPPAQPVPLSDVRQWWAWTPGADWRHPEGPGSSLAGKDQHPVVHVSWDDAAAYARWAGKRLPTEAEFEYAARGGLEGKAYAWGDDKPSDTNLRANIWQGHFPDYNSKADGYERTSPVQAFPANGYGLYDMAGNVWEWCADWYRPDTYRHDAAQSVSVNPQGPARGLDPTQPYAPVRVQRGGSFLCNEDFCASYRVAARMKCSPDTSMSHVGFRCALSAR